MTKHSITTKVAYGAGQMAEQIKVQGFDVFVFFYFNQILGLEGFLTGFAIALALIVDAITDPVVGSLSDNWKSKYGRRHPFMYFSAIPLGLLWTLLFFPPTDFGQMGLFIWLMSFAVLIRTVMTFHNVPHLALGAELSNDYEERTSIVSYRVIMGYIGGGAVIFLCLGIFSPPSLNYTNPLLDPQGYSKVAVFCGVLIVAIIFISAFGTRKQVPFLPKAPDMPEPFSFKRVYSEFRLALRNQSFRAIFLGMCFSGVSYGITRALDTYMNVFFWKFSPKQMSSLALMYVPAFILAGIFAPLIQKKYDKKPILIMAAIAIALLGILIVSLRLMDLVPHGPSGSAAVEVMMVFVLLTGFAIALIFISSASMMADVSLEHAGKTGKSQQGIFFSAISFSGKLASGLGHLIAGISISLIHFPVQATDPNSVNPQLIQNLGFIFLLGVIIGLFSISFYRKYSITRESNKELSTKMNGSFYK